MYRSVGESVEIAVGAQRDRISGRETVRLPKGKVETGETPEQAALREVSEEAGLEAEIVAPLTTLSYDYNENESLVSKQVHFYLMKHVSGTPHARDGELLNVRWCSFEEALDTLTFDGERLAAERARGQLAGSQDPP